MSQIFQTLQGEHMVTPVTQYKQNDVSQSTNPESYFTSMHRIMINVNKIALPLIVICFFGSLVAVSASDIMTCRATCDAVSTEAPEGVTLPPLTYCQMGCTVASSLGQDVLSAYTECLLKYKDLANCVQNCVNNLNEYASSRYSEL